MSSRDNPILVRFRRFAEGEELNEMAADFLAHRDHWWLISPRTAHQLEAGRIIGRLEQIGGDHDEHR